MSEIQDQIDRIMNEAALEDDDLEKLCEFAVSLTELDATKCADWVMRKVNRIERERVENAA